MKNLFNYVAKTLSGLKRALKPAMIAGACALLIFSAAAPAMAFGNSDSKASKGLEQLDGIQEKSENAAASGPKTGANSTGSVSKDASTGLNGVQGKANKKNMISPDEANGNTVESNVEDALDSVTP